MFTQNGSRPPADMVTPQEAQTFFFIFTHIPMVIFLAVAARNLIVKKDATLLAFLVGGALATIFEPIVDVLGFCYFPSQGQWVGLRVYERDIPIYMWAVYSWFVGGQAYIFYKRFRDSKCTKSALWKLYSVLILVNVVLELPGLLLGVYTYYGNQPFQVLGFPLWWPILNPLMPIAAGFIASVLVPHATWLGNLLIIPLIAMSDGAVNGAVAWPVWTALGGEVGYTATHSAAAASFLLALLTVWGITTQLPNELPSTAAKSR